MKLTSSKSRSSLWLLALPVLMGAKGCAIGNEEASLGKTGAAGAAGASITALGAAGDTGAPNTGGQAGQGTGGGSEPRAAAGSGGEPGAVAGSGGASAAGSGGEPAAAAGSGGKPGSDPCPDYAKPACEETEYLTWNTDENGCSVPVCEPCPVYSPEEPCAEGEYRAPRTDAHGCFFGAACAPCPTYPEPECEDGEALLNGRDVYGCSMPICGSCPDIDMSCDDGEYIAFTTNEDGCSVPTCQSCPEYSAPLCEEDEELAFGSDDNGCPMPICQPLSPSACFSPTQNLDTAYSGGVGCPCGEYEQDRCIDGVALFCHDGTWAAVADGPCEPSTCNRPLEVNDDCLLVEHIVYWHNAETGQCEPFWGGCATNDNTFMNLDDCAAQCLSKETPTAVVPWPDCEGLGDELSHSGGDFSYTTDGQVVQIEQNWGCGCPTRPEFVLTYEVASPLQLHLCHDELADSCEMSCSETLSFDLSQALQAAGATEFVFVD